ncbi:NPHN-like protein [Mya arenaria]|uniref:NPHN-like protein n=1 Tax=Mya arenaria TaxID=6604 RepID=A0ABY7EGK4_MYAAR|nr:NPHN-like protein [Mya arenaria]
MHSDLGITSTVISSPIVNPVSVIVNTVGTFQCQTSPGNPQATVAWYKANTNSTTGNETQITSGTNTSSTSDGDLLVTIGILTLQVQKDDHDLSVYCHGPKMRILQDVSAVRGKKFVYECLYEPGNPPYVSFEWKRSGTNASWTIQKTKNMTIQNVQRSDEANYTCNVSSVLRPTLTSATTVKSDTATFHLHLTLNNISNASVEIEEHSTNNLHCSLESNPASDMFIFKDGKTTLERPAVHQLIYGMVAECSDTGVYTCSGYNQYGMADNASLNYTACEQENVTLSYTIAAYPVPEPSQFIWKKCINESEGSCNFSLDGMLKYNVKSEGLSSSLTIRDVEIEDYGMYQFSVSNNIGSRLIEWLHLKHIGKPDSPSDFHIIQEEISETSAVLTWVPGFDNGLPQRFYITYTKKGDSSGKITNSIKHTHEAKVNYTLICLESETQYIVSIYASNEKGLSPTINDTFITLKHIPGEQADSDVALIGGVVGGGIVAVLVIIGVVLIVKKFRTSANPAGQSVSGTDSPGCNAAQPYEDLSKKQNTSDYDALRKGDIGSETVSSGCNTAKTYEELSMKSDTSVYNALKKGGNGLDNSQELDKSKSQSHMHYGNVKKEDPVYNNTVL